MKKKFVHVSIPALGARGYVQPMDEIANAIDAEFDGAAPGDTILLQLVEMTEVEYKKLPEFEGW